MGKFLTAGIIQRETIVKVPQLPIQYSRVTRCYDTIFGGIGGDAYNVANALKWLGDDVTLVSNIGERDSHLFQTKHLDPRYVFASLEQTPSAVIFYDSERKLQTFEDINDMEEVPYDMARFAEALADADLVILSNTKFCEPFLAPVKESGKKLVVNFNGLDRENELDQKFLTVADIIYVSDDEIKSDPYEAMRIMSEEYSMECGILGMGKAGLLMYTRADNMVVPYPAVHIKEVVNTVGAGNALLSCFLHYYHKNGNYHEAIKYALMFAAYKIGYVGTSKGFMTEDEMKLWYDLIWNRYK